MRQSTTIACCGRSLRLGAWLVAILSLEPSAVADPTNEDSQSTFETTEAEAGEQQEIEEEYTWLDEAEENVARRANELVRKIDNFYGEPVDDFSRASSRLRVLVGASYDDVDDLEYRFKIRGKVDLPRISKRLALVFEGEEGDAFGGQRFDDDDNRAGVQLNLNEGGNHRLDFTTNANSSLDLRAGWRYRYDRDFSDRFDIRYVQDIAYDTDKKAFTRGRPYLNYLTSEDSMLRLLGRWEYGEESFGVEWQVGTVWVLKLDEHTGIAPAIYAVGQTDPDETRNYGLGFRYRTNVYKDFLFMEVVPGYMWKKPTEFHDRQGTWGIGLYFEMHFEADKDAPYGGRLGLLPDGSRTVASPPDASP